VRDKKATGTGDDDMRGYVLKMLGAGCQKIMTYLVNNIQEPGDWLNDFIEGKTIALKKKPVATKRSDHYTISLIAHTAKTVARILRRRIGRKVEDVLGEDQFEFRRGKGARDNIRTKFGNRLRFVCLLYRLAEGI
jgi:hypothetical protein